MKRYAPVAVKEKYPYPSKFGSHKSMVVGLGEQVIVVCQDELGEYETDKWRLDNGLADPNRFERF